MGGKPAKLSDRDFINLFRTKGAHEVQRRSGATIRNVFNRRNNLEIKYRTRIVSPNQKNARPSEHHPERATLNVRNGVVLIGSDGHYWPGDNAPAHRAFVKFCKDLKPSAVIMNGDAFDGARISRHSPIGWEEQPEVVDELEAAQERLNEIETAAGRARKIWPLGNHDSRFETRLATAAPEYAKINGVHLRDHFPLWEPCWSCWINDDVVVKHRYKGGIHGAHNNTLWAGKTIVTGHTHQLKVAPLPDYNGVRWGVETGCLSDTYGRQFTDYTEDNPRLWQGGFAVLTFSGGKLLPPELVTAWGKNAVTFRGKVISV